MAELPRYRCALPATLRKRSGSVALLTSEVSHRDLFVRTNDSPPQNSLVRLELTLPPDNAVLSISACVESVTPPSPTEEHYPGFGARLIGLSGPLKDRWYALIELLRKQYPAAKHDTVVFARRSYRDLFAQRTKLSVELPFRPSSVDDLSQIVEVAVGGGVVTVPTPMALILGAPVDLMLTHPLTEEIVALPGIVRARTAGTDTVDVRLEPQESDSARVLREFVDSMLVVEEYDVDVRSAPELRG